MTDRPDLHVVGTPPDAAAPARASTDYTGMDHAAWLAAGRDLVGARASSAWALVDWVSGGAAALGAKTARQAAEDLGISAGKFSDYLTVSKAYPKFRRRNSLQFSHHAEVARLDEADRERILDAAEAEGWTVTHIRKAAQAASREQGYRRRIAHLERDLAKARGEKSRAEAALGRMERAVADAIGDATRAWAAIDKVTAAFFDGDDPDGAAGVHGNAEIKAAKRLLSKLAACGRTVNAIAERIDARLTAHTVPRTRRP